MYRLIDGKICYGNKEVELDEVIKKLNDYEYEKRRFTVHMHEELFKTKAVNEHLIRENRILIRKMHDLAYRGSFDDDDIVESLVMIDDSIFAELQKTQLENEELKKELNFLKH